jgi:hypothetical protein
MRLALKFRLQLLVQCLAIFATLGLPSCKNRDRSQGSSLRGRADIQYMTKLGDKYQITCIDGKVQLVDVTVFGKLQDSEICPNVTVSECPDSLKYYPSLKSLKSPEGVFTYMDGRSILSDNNRNFVYSSRGNLKLINNSGGMAFPDGKNLFVANQGYYYPGGKSFLYNSGQVDYPDGKLFFAATGGQIKYPDGATLSDSAKNFYYPQTKILKDTSGNFKFNNGSYARNGGRLYRLENAVEQPGPITIRQDIISPPNTKLGHIQFSVQPTSDNYFIYLPDLTPGFLAQYNSADNKWYFRYDIENPEAPLQIAFNGKTISKVFFLKTGYAGETVMVDFSESKPTCSMIKNIP